MKKLLLFPILILGVQSLVVAQSSDPLATQESIDQLMKEKGQEVVFSGKKGGSAGMKVLQLDLSGEQRNKHSFYISEYGKFGIFGPGIELAHKFDLSEKLSIYSTFGETLLAAGGATFLTELTATGTYYLFSQNSTKKTSISATSALGFNNLSANEIFVFKFKTPAIRRFGVHLGAMYNGIKCYRGNEFSFSSLIVNIGLDMNTYHSARVVLSSNSKRVFYNRKEKHQYLNLLIANPLDTNGLSVSYSQVEKVFPRFGLMYGFRNTIQKKSYLVGSQPRRKAIYYGFEFGFIPGLLLDESLYNYCIFSTRVGVKI